ncbi:secreted protein containing DUF1501 [Rhodopirellula maiorica SM1]|uniref:Secreted protein containing DUF1501 n=1 Tax=Rhodopirellula maiorica SM1 TaxID=1265738 RepID=M5RAU9_9BACT|nr:DUF1501 domain-containing protein [Rhodopirellula maiorica]EMI16618.1 secreted protein containing DUF1501 [Rhodopirellula maiorica SM1]
MSLDPFAVNRRHFFKNSCTGVGVAALASLFGGESPATAASHRGVTGTHFAPKAKRIIYLFQSGGPAQQDLFDYKPLLNEMNGQELPSEVRGQQRLTGMSVNQSSLPIAGSQFKFAQHGDSGAWLSELLPYHRDIVDDVCFIKSMHTEAINHDPAITMFQTGSQIAGRPSLGSWLSYGLGSENEDLPAFIVLVSANQGGQPLYARLWGNGFLDSKYQGVQFRSGNDPVLYLSNPSGIPSSRRRAQLDAIKTLNQHQFEKELDPEIESRIAQYEMAYRMQTSVPDAADFSDEPESTFELYGDDAKQPGTFAANCLLARRLAERDVRFIQLYHQGWDQHSNLPRQIKGQAQETDQASAALVKDLKRLGLLDDTLVIWGGEFGRTSYTQGVLTNDNYGRDHHPRCFTTWMAGGGIKPGMTYGATDEFGYNVTENGVHVHDFNATILHLMGIDHERLTYKYQGRRFRLTDVHGHVLDDIIA